MSHKEYVIYDERAILGDTDEASVLEACRSLRDVRRSHFDGGKLGPMGAVYEYDVTAARELVNEQFLGTVADVKARK
jgi:hypothetical protein